MATTFNDTDEEEIQSQGLWQIVETFKQKANAYLKQHPVVQNFHALHISLKKISAHDKEMIRQRLHGFRLQDGKHRLAWDAEHDLYLIEPITP